MHVETIIPVVQQKKDDFLGKNILKWLHLDLDLDF